MVRTRYKGQKHEVWEGGVHVAGWVNGGLLPASVRGESTALSPLPLISSYKSEKSLCGTGSTHSPLIHVTDWAPTIMTILTGTDMAASARPGMALDGVSMWSCLTAGQPGSDAKQAACQAAGRRDILYNVNLLCDDPSASPTPGSMDFVSEVPAPKAGANELILLKVTVFVAAA